MVFDVKHLLRDCYMPCVLTYFGAEIFDAHPFLKNVYDTPNIRNANVKAVYIFLERHNFKSADAESFFLKHGLILLPLFLPVNYVSYADERTMSDVLLTCYSSLLVGMWNKARDYADGVRSASTSSSSQFPAPIEIYVQRDCGYLKEIRNRVNNRLVGLTNGNSQPVFKQMADSIANIVERTGKSTVSDQL